MKVMTIVSGKVSPSKQGDFEAGYRSVKGDPMPPGLERSFLLKSTDGTGMYAIESVWSNREALEAMRASTKPRAIALFEEVGVTPNVEVREVTESVP